MRTGFFRRNPSFECYFDEGFFDFHKFYDTLRSSITAQSPESVCRLSVAVR